MSDDESTNEQKNDRTDIESVPKKSKMSDTCQVTEIQGDLLNATSPIVAHQCNCRTVVGKGLSQAVFAKYPYADIYKESAEIKRVPGHTVIREPLPQDKMKGYPIVANLLGQDRPGRPYGYVETRETRLVWFKSALSELSVYMKDRDIREVAMPKHIGCGLAGGVWHDYLRTIQEWSEQECINVVLYHLSTDCMGTAM